MAAAAECRVAATVCRTMALSTVLVLCCVVSVINGQQVQQQQPPVQQQQQPPPAQQPAPVQQQQVDHQQQAQLQQQQAQQQAQLQQQQAQQQAQLQQQQAQQAQIQAQQQAQLQQQQAQQQAQMQAQQQAQMQAQQQLTPEQVAQLQQQQAQQRAQMHAQLQAQHAQMSPQHQAQMQAQMHAQMAQLTPQQQAQMQAQIQAQQQAQMQAQLAAQRQAGVRSPPGVPPPPAAHMQPPPAAAAAGGQRLPPAPGPGQQLPTLPGGLQLPVAHHQPIGNAPAEPEFDLLAPGLAMDYRIWVEPGKEECFYQYVQPGAQFYVSFHTLRGGDGQTGYAVRDPTGQLVHPYAWKKQSEYETTSDTGGYFTACIDNQFSRFAGKLVNMYLTTFRYDEWEKHSEELEQYDIVATNFTNGLGLVDHKVQIAKQYLSHSKSRAAYDWNLLVSNNSYVMRWSLVQVAVVIGTGCLQVFFVRKLFDTGSRPRGGI